MIYIDPSNSLEFHRNILDFQRFVFTVILGCLGGLPGHSWSFLACAGPAGIIREFKSNEYTFFCRGGSLAIPGHAWHAEAQKESCVSLSQIDT
jgi:hypothetical protein